MANTEITFKKYNTRDEMISSPEVNEATFSVIRTTGCNENENNNNSGNIKDLYLGDTKMTDVYNSRKEGEDVRTTVEVGGIPAGTKLSDLTNMSLGEVLDKMLFKTFYPSYTTPTLTITGPSGDYLVGSSYPEISGYTPNKGKYTSYNNNLNYAGEPVEGSFVGTNTAGGTVGTETITIKGSITFSAGPTPKDSDGNNYTNEGSNIPYVGGTVNSNELKIYPYYEWFATGESVSSETAPTIDYTSYIQLKRLGVVRSMGITKKTVMLDISGGDITHKQTIKVPGVIENVKVLVQGNWQNYNFSDLYDHNGTEIRNGKTYHIYTMKDIAYPDGGSFGGSRLKFDVRP